MQFDRAMSLLLAGFQISRASWNGREDDEGQIIHQAIMPTENGFYITGKRTRYGRMQEFGRALFLNSADLAADDWCAVQPEAGAMAHPAA